MLSTAPPRHVSAMDVGAVKPPVIRRILCYYCRCMFIAARQRAADLRGAVARVAQMPSTDPSPSVTVDQLTRALGEAVIRIWSNLPQDVQDLLFKEAVASQGDSIKSQLAVFLHGKHSRTSDPLGNPREMKEPDSLGG